MRKKKAGGAAVKGFKLVSSLLTPHPSRVVFTRFLAELIEFLRQYPVGELIGYRGIGEGIENANYFVDTADGAGC